MEGKLIEGGEGQGTERSVFWKDNLSGIVVGSIEEGGSGPTRVTR